MEIKTTDAILICLLISLIGVIIVGIYYFTNESAECIKNPVSYGLKDISENISCYCDSGYKINKQGLFKQENSFGLG